MGTRANTTLAWMGTGLLLVTAPFVASAGIDDPGWDPPPAYPTDVDAGLEPDTQPGDEGTGVDTGSALDSGLVTDDSSPAVGDDATGPRLPDGGMPTPLPTADTTAGCQCTQRDARGTSAGTAGLALGAAVLATVIGRRRRR